MVRFRFAKLKLVYQAKLYWATIERTLRLGGHEPIVTWRAMKAKLKEKYIPTLYRQGLLDQWQRVSQGSKSVYEYIMKFDEYSMLYDLDKDEDVILSRFRASRRDDIKRELYLREIKDIEHERDMPYKPMIISPRPL